MKTLRRQTTTQPHHASPVLGLGQRLLLGCYASLFALVLPFICWGALAESGHPHRTPHFVFADPVLVKARPINESADELTMTGAAITQRQHDQKHSGSLLAVVTAASDELVCPLSAPDTPVRGRAMPTLLLFSILLLLLVADRVCQQPARLAFVRWLRPPLPFAYVCAVPLPPPRLSRYPHFCPIFA